MKTTETVVKAYFHTEINEELLNVKQECACFPPPPSKVSTSFLNRVSSVAFRIYAE